MYEPQTGHAFTARPRYGDVEKKMLTNFVLSKQPPVKIGGIKIGRVKYYVQRV